MSAYGRGLPLVTGWYRPKADSDIRLNNNIFTLMLHRSEPISRGHLANWCKRSLPKYSQGIPEEEFFRTRQVPRA